MDKAIERDECYGLVDVALHLAFLALGMPLMVPSPPLEVLVYQSGFRAWSFYYTYSPLAKQAKWRAFKAVSIYENYIQRPSSLTSVNPGTIFEYPICSNFLPFRHYWATGIFFWRIYWGSIRLVVVTAARVFTVCFLSIFRSSIKAML